MACKRLTTRRATVASLADGLLRRLEPALTASLSLGIASTLGDWIWQRYLTDGAIVPALVHGVLFFVIVAALLGRRTDSPGVHGRLFATLPAAGLLIAAGFYPVAGFAGYLGALLVSWVAMWLSFALLHRWARRSSRSTVSALARGVLAAVGSGLAFWAVSGMWTLPPAETGYALRLTYWTFAFLPGFVALLYPTSKQLSASRS